MQGTVLSERGLVMRQDAPDIESAGTLCEVGIGFSHFGRNAQAGAAGGERR